MHIYIYIHIHINICIHIHIHIPIRIHIYIYIIWGSIGSRRTTLSFFQQKRPHSSLGNFNPGSGLYNFWFGSFDEKHNGILMILVFWKNSEVRPFLVILDDFHDF